MLSHFAKQLDRNRHVGRQTEKVADTSQQHSLHRTVKIESFYTPPVFDAPLG